jgi:AraC-like DNA-binding protein
MASMEEKREWLKLIQINPDYTFYLNSGWIPSNMLHLSKDIQAIGYGVACLILWRKKVSVLKFELFVRIRKHVIKMSIFFMAYAIISLIVDVRFLVSGESEQYLRESDWALLTEFLIFTLLLSFNLYFFFGDGPHSITSNLPIHTAPKPIEVKKPEKDLETVDYSAEKNVLESSPQKALSLELELKEEEKQLIRRLFYGMETSEWYKKRGFSASDCAEHLGIEKHVLSSLFKKAILYRFNDFVNHYRVLYVKRAIKNGGLKVFTLEHLAAEAGFNSRTTFYNAFLKSEGVNPRQYVLQAME